MATTPGSHQVALNTAIAAERTHAWRQCITAYEELLRLLYPDDFQNLDEFAERLHGSHSRHSPVETSAALLFEVHFHLGRAYMRVNELAKAHKQLSLAVKLATRHTRCAAGCKVPMAYCIPALQARAIVEAQRGNFQEAGVDLTDAIIYDRDNEDTYCLRALLSRRIQRFSAALEDVAFVIKRNPHNTAAHLARGLCLFDMERGLFDYGTAIMRYGHMKSKVEFEKARELDPFSQQFVLNCLDFDKNALIQQFVDRYMHTMRVPHLIYQVPTSLIRSTTQYNASISPVSVQTAPISSSYASMQTSTNIAELYVGLQAVLTSAAASLQEHNSDVDTTHPPDRPLAQQQALELSQSTDKKQFQSLKSPTTQTDLDAPMHIVITAPSSQSLPQPPQESQSLSVVIKAERISLSSEQSTAAESVSENHPPSNSPESTKTPQAGRPKSRPQSSRSAAQQPSVPQPYKPGNGPRLYDKPWLSGTNIGHSSKYQPNHYTIDGRPSKSSTVDHAQHEQAVKLTSVSLDVTPAATPPSSRPNSAQHRARVYNLAFRDRLRKLQQVYNPSEETADPYSEIVMEESRRKAHQSIIRDESALRPRGPPPKPQNLPSADRKQTIDRPTMHSTTPSPAKVHKIHTHRTLGVTRPSQYDLDKMFPVAAAASQFLEASVRTAMWQPSVQIGPESLIQSLQDRILHDY